MKTAFLVNALLHYHLRQQQWYFTLSAWLVLVFLLAGIKNIYPLRRIVAGLCRSGFRPSLVRSLVSTTFGPSVSKEDKALISAWRNLPSKERKEAIGVWLLGERCSTAHGKSPAALRAPTDIPSTATPLEDFGSAAAGKALLGSSAGAAMAVGAACMRAEGARRRNHAPVSAEG